MAAAFENLTPQEKEEKFRKWLESRESRKAQSGIKRTVTKQLVAKYKDEFNKYLVAAGGKVKD